MGLDLVRLQQNVILLTCDIKKLYNYIQYTVWNKLWSLKSNLLRKLVTVEFNSGSKWNTLLTRNPDLQICLSVLEGSDLNPCFIVMSVPYSLSPYCCKVPYLILSQKPCPILSYPRNPVLSYLIPETLSYLILKTCPIYLFQKHCLIFSWSPVLSTP